jgi:Flp pilus assembly protein TadG
MMEMAIILPLLLLLLLGILEMGRVVMIYQIATNATREAARQAVVPGATDSAVLSTCNTYLDRGGISATGRTVQILNGGGSSSSLAAIGSHQPVTIRAQIPFSENTWGFAQIMGGRTLTSTVTMRRE